MIRVLHSLIQRTADTRTAVLGEEMTVAVVVIFFDNPCVLCWFRREGGFKFLRKVGNVGGRSDRVLGSRVGGGRGSLLGGELG